MFCDRLLCYVFRHRLSNFNVVHCLIVFRMVADGSLSTKNSYLRLLQSRFFLRGAHILSTTEPSKEQRPHQYEEMQPTTIVISVSTVQCHSHLPFPTIIPTESLRDDIGLVSCRRGLSVGASSPRSAFWLGTQRCAVLCYSLTICPCCSLIAPCRNSEFFPSWPISCLHSVPSYSIFDCGISDESRDFHNLQLNHPG